MKKRGKIFIGTSGWHYSHWMEVFYPADIKEEDQLEYYQRYFDTVEINNSFYNLPLAKTFTHWHDKVNKDFLFSVKASRYITHMKKLNVDKSSITKFLTRVKKLQSGMGPVLFQLPPKWNINAERLQTFLEQLPPHHRYTFEFRNDTWLTDDVYQLLEKHNAAFCMYELAGYHTPDIITAGFAYIRLHGPGDKYQGSYTTAMLKKWVIKLKKWSAAGIDVYCYFDNDQSAFAVANAQKLKAMVNG